MSETFDILQGAIVFADSIRDHLDTMPPTHWPSLDDTADMDTLKAIHGHLEAAYDELLAFKDARDL